MTAVVLVSGAPGAGKSTLAAPLSRPHSEVERQHLLSLDRPIVEMLTEFDGPTGLGAVIRVDTTGPVDVAALAARVAALLPPPA